MAAFLIGAPVGANGSNRSADVAVVQFLLNNVPPGQGGANPELVKDGLCGPKTIRAIRQFQTNQFGWHDELVEPGKVTISKLNGLQPDITPQTPPCGDELRPPPPRLPNALDKLKANRFQIGLNFAVAVADPATVAVPAPGSDSPDARTTVFIADVPPAPRPPVGPLSPKEAAVQNGPEAFTWICSAMAALRTPHLMRGRHGQDRTKSGLSYPQSALPSDLGRSEADDVLGLPDE